MSAPRPYANAIQVLEAELTITEELYEALREGCLKDKKLADRTQSEYDLACEFRHAIALLNKAKPSGIL